MKNNDNERANKTPSDILSFENKKKLCTDSILVDIMSLNSE